MGEKGGEGNTQQPPGKRERLQTHACLFREAEEKRLQMGRACLLKGCIVHVHRLSSDIAAIGP